MCGIKSFSFGYVCALKGAIERRERKRGIHCYSFIAYKSKERE